MNEEKMKEYVAGELLGTIVELYPFKNKTEVDFTLKLWSKSFIENCINIASSENADLRELIYKSLKRVKKDLAQLDDNRYFTFKIVRDAIIKTATKDLHSELELETEKAYNLLYSKLLHMKTCRNYTFKNDILGASVNKLGGVGVIVGRTVKAGPQGNIYNSYEIDKFKKDFFITYKNLKKAQSQGLDIGVKRILGKFGDMGITVGIFDKEETKKLGMKIDTKMIPETVKNDDEFKKGVLEIVSKVLGAK